MNATGEYRWPVRDNEGWVRLEWIHRDGQYSDIEALTNQQTLGPGPDTGLSRPVGPNEFPYKTPDYDVLNLRLGFDTPTWHAISLHPESDRREILYRHAGEFRY